MITVYERSSQLHRLDESINELTQEQIFESFTYPLPTGSVYFSYEMYKDGMEWLKENRMTLNDIEPKNWYKVIPPIQVSLKNFATLIYLECQSNPAFFITEFIMVPGTSGTPLTLDIGRYTQIRCFRAQYNSMLYNPRNTGSSFLLKALMVWVKIFRPGTSDIELLCESNQKCVEFIADVDRLKANVPTVFHYPDIRGNVDDVIQMDSISLRLPPDTIYTFIDGFEFLSQSQYQYIAGILSPPRDIAAYSVVQNIKVKHFIIGNSAINTEPSVYLQKITEKCSVYIGERYYDNIYKGFYTRVKALDPPNELNHSLICIKYDEHSIFTENELENLRHNCSPYGYAKDIQRIRQI